MLDGVPLSSKISRLLNKFSSYPNKTLPIHSYAGSNSGKQIIWYLKILILHIYWLCTEFSILCGAAGLLGYPSGSKANNKLSAFPLDLLYEHSTITLYRDRSHAEISVVIEIYISIGNFLTHWKLKTQPHCKFSEVFFSKIRITLIYNFQIQTMIKK